MTDHGLLRATLDKFPSLTVHVLGDVIVDLYTSCTLVGTMSKTAALSVQRGAQTAYVGGAGIVAKHIAAAGATVTLTTLLGQDAAAEFARTDLLAAGVHLTAVPRSPTPTKERFVIAPGGQAVLQVETWDAASLDAPRTAVLMDAVAGCAADVVVVADFRHGIFTTATTPRLLAAIPSGALKAADSQLSSRWGMILDFPGFDLLTPNEREARFALGDQDAPAPVVATRLYLQASCRHLLLTMGARGLWAIEPHGEFSLPAYATHVVDPIGAGDALLAYAALALRVTDDLQVAATLGSLAAAVACETAGNVPVTPEAVDQKIEALR